MKINPAKYQNKTASVSWQPRRILLFSGHMIDAPDRVTPRFPGANEPVAARKIAETLERLNVGDQELALTQGAAGGDILFAEACLQLGVKLQLLQPFEEKTFIENSVIVSGDHWLERYKAITSRMDIQPLAAPQLLGKLPAEMDAYERCNLWLLNTALAYGAEKLIFICLWDGFGGDGPGGTADMVARVKSQQGTVIWLDTHKLW